MIIKWQQEKEYHDDNRFELYLAPFRLIIVIEDETRVYLALSSDVNHEKMIARLPKSESIEDAQNKALSVFHALMFKTQESIAEQILK